MKKSYLFEVEILSSFDSGDDDGDEYTHTCKATDREGYTIHVTQDGGFAYFLDINLAQNLHAEPRHPSTVPITYRLSQCLNTHGDTAGRPVGIIGC